jgi:N-acetylglucosamine-6-phosphate deacetylase
MVVDSEIKALHYETGKPVTIKINNGIIKEISETGFGPSEQLRDLYISPGLIDNQINGYKGVDFSETDLSPTGMREAVEAIRKDGVTSFFPTVITNSHENLLKVFKNLADSLEDNLIRESVPGFHLEGPYISKEAGFLGCHPKEFIRKPLWDEFAKYQEAAMGNIREVTIAPETDGAIPFIELCCKHGIIVAIGHTNASAAQIKDAVSAGARISTHLANGCANTIDRHKNPIWPQLANDLLAPSIIADGHHLLPEEIQVFFKIKGPDNIILTSDMTHLAGMDPGRYIFFGSEVIYTDDGLIRNPVLNCLAGASLPIRTGVENMMNFTGCSMGVAVNLATKNVARICKLNDRGSLAAGKRADLVLFEMNDNKFNIKQIYVNGKLL